MKRVIIECVRSVARQMGYTVERYQLSKDIAGVRSRILKTQGVDLVLDVGANIGQYGKGLRSQGYTGRIVSFEPVSEAFAEVRRAANGDPNWVCHQRALGERDETSQISVNSQSATSSLLPMGSAFRKAAPEITRVREETIQVSRLDSLASELWGDAQKVYLKLDVQGFERSVFAGAVESLADPRIIGVECELSLAGLYEGQMLYNEMIDWIEEKGLSCFYISRGFCDNTTGRTFELEGIFLRRDLIS